MGTILYTTDSNVTTGLRGAAFARTRSWPRRTRRRREARALIDVRVLDHLIVAGSDVTSLAKRGPI
jgi:hypothetical protein